MEGSEKKKEADNSGFEPHVSDEQGIEPWTTVTIPEGKVSDNTDILSDSSFSRNDDWMTELLQSTSVRS